MLITNPELVDQNVFFLLLDILTSCKREEVHQLEFIIGFKYLGFKLTENYKSTILNVLTTHHQPQHLKTRSSHL